MDENKELYCPFCGVRLSLHDLVVDGKSTYICDICGYITDEDGDKQWFSDDEDDDEDEGVPL